MCRPFPFADCAVDYNLGTAAAQDMGRITPLCYPFRPPDPDQGFHWSYPGMWDMSRGFTRVPGA